MDDSIQLVSQGMDGVGRNSSRQQAKQIQKTEKHSRCNQVDPQLRNACAEMESLFINYLLQEMRATVDKSGFLGGGRAEEIFTSLLDEELSKEISASGGIGLSSMLLEQLGKGRATRSED
jgi:peptidoglycan hydrolase FlgJ